MVKKVLKVVAALVCVAAAILAFFGIKEYLKDVDGMYFD